MTLAEILKSKGIDDTNIQAILDDMKANKIFTAAEENLDIRYGKLKTDHEGVTKQLGEANTLIEELKKSNKGNEDLQGKIAGYEQQIAELQAQNNELKAESAMDRKLTAAGAKATDLDYLKFQWKKKGEIKLDDNGEIQGSDDVVAALKTQFPTQFEASGSKKFEERRLPGGDGGDVTVTREQFLQMGYNDRLKLKQENEELYKKLTKF